MFRTVHTSLRLLRPVQHRALCASRAFSMSTPRWSPPLDGFLKFDEELKRRGLNDPAKLAALKQTPIFKAMQADPSIIACISEFTTVLKKHGFDYTRQPSKIAMLKLGLDSEFREAFAKLHEKMMAAGIDMTSQDVQRQMASLFQAK
ncbi:hypothetical protein BDZ89DRAFT_1110761 [Hymenopellis radicata]|nr:hypothetical protein BDZ89DRAFT_1110761 [Hymenopellis radicata]